MAIILLTHVAMYVTQCEKIRSGLCAHSKPDHEPNKLNIYRLFLPALPQKLIHYSYLFSYHCHIILYALLFHVLKSRETQT